MQETNAKLDSLIIAQASNNQTALINFVGKDVSVALDSLNHSEGAIEDITLEVSGEADEVTVVIEDADGNTIRTLRLGEEGPGPAHLTWDGLDDDGNPAPEGTYKLFVTANDKEGEPIDVQSQVTLHIEGVSFENGFPELLSGDLRVALGDIIAIKESHE